MVCLQLGQLRHAVRVVRSRKRRCQINRFGGVAGNGFVLVIGLIESPHLGHGGTNALQLGRDPGHRRCVTGTAVLRVTVLRVTVARVVRQGVSGHCRGGQRRGGRCDNRGLHGGADGTGARRLIFFGLSGQRAGYRDGAIGIGGLGFSGGRNRWRGLFLCRFGPRRVFACRLIGFNLRPQDHAVALDLRLDATLDLALGDPVQHLGIGCRRFGPEIAVLGGQVAEIFRYGFHRVERLVKALQRAREGAIRHRENFAWTNHTPTSLINTCARQ